MHVYSSALYDGTLQCHSDQQNRTVAVECNSPLAHSVLGETADSRIGDRSIPMIPVSHPAHLCIWIGHKQVLVLINVSADILTALAATAHLLDCSGMRKL